MFKSPTRLACLCLALLVVAVASSVASAATKVVVGFGATAGRPEYLGLMQVVEGFARRFPNYEVEVLAGYSTNKLVVESAAEVAPDVVITDGPSISAHASQGLFVPLDDFILRSKLNRSDFVPASWRESTWNGKVWAMFHEPHPNFALVWNKQLFAEAGLNPDQAPTTTQEFATYFPKLTTKGSDGRLSKIAMVPWEVFGNANTVYTWGWIFGGEFYDYDAGAATADHPRNVEAVTYLQEYYDRYAAEVPALNEGLSAWYQRIYVGREAMGFRHPTEYFGIVQNAPELELGLAPMFRHPDNPTDPSWAGGWALGLAAHSRNKDHAAAWEFLRYMTADPEGTSLYAKASGTFPSYLKSPIYREYLRDPHMRVYAEIMQTLVHQRPVIPVQPVYSGGLNSALDRVFSKQESPREALRFVSEQVDIAMREFMGKLSGR